MRIRTIVQLVIVFLLVLLLFWGCGAGLGRKTPVKRTGPQMDGGFSDAPLSSNQSLLEKEPGELRSPTEEDKAVIMPTSHSSWVNNGVYEVFGEVENVGRMTGTRIKARVVFQTPTWYNRLATVERLIDRPTLAPGDKSSFKVRLAGINPSSVGSYVLMMVVGPRPVRVEPEEDLLNMGATAIQGRSRNETDSLAGEDADGKATSGSGGGESNWIVLLLIITNLIWGTFRYRQWH